jgi:hypothetical protein
MGFGARFEQLSRYWRVMVAGGRSEEILLAEREVIHDVEAVKSYDHLARLEKTEELHSVVPCLSLYSFVSLNKFVQVRH